MKYLFFHLYNRMFQAGKFSKNHPEWNAFAMITAGSVCWLLLFFEAYFFIIKHTSFPVYMPFISLIIAGFLLIILHRKLIYKDRYKLIYETFKSETKAQQTRGLFISVLFFLLPFFLVIAISLYYNL